MREFHISCSNLLKTVLDVAKLCILPGFLPQPSNFFTRIYPPYPWHFATLVVCKAFWEDLGVSPRFRVCSTENGWRCLFTQAADLSPQPSNGWKLEPKISLTMWFFLHITVNLCLNKQTTCHASTPTETLTFWSGSNRFNCWHAMFFVVSDSNIVTVS